MRGVSDKETQSRNRLRGERTSHEHRFNTINGDRGTATKGQVTEGSRQGERPRSRRETTRRAQVKRNQGVWGNKRQQYSKS